MLEVKNLYKDYRSKTGVTVHALNGISIKFRKTGLVFIVGKSGCGKSTLLNVLGGLDKPDGGEIIINGTSSLKFKPSDFDSYRNTYVGFVFQEYNLLKDFSVGANVALALELQSKRATNESVNDILKTVDLDGYGARRINELSGGQKQRVAIARALVKDPEIILADEPSGALDSQNAKQLFDTLKKLSKTKLVIVVSHDREFASFYGDRVIEMSDGKIIGDLEKTFSSSAAKSDEDKNMKSESGEKENADGLKFENGEIFVPEKYVLTYVDLRAINEYLSNHGAGRIKKTGVTAEGNARFKPFDEKTVEAETEQFKPIKSTLPFKNAIKMGASNLGIKKFRLVLTIILSVISFTMFGLYDVMIGFNERESTINSICDNGIKFASFQKVEKVFYDENKKDLFYERSGQIDKTDLEKIEKDVGVKMTGVYSNTAREFENYVDDYSKLKGKGYYSIYATSIFGYVELNGSPSDYGITLLGSSRLPETFDEMMLPEYIVKTFMRAGFKSDDDVTVKIAKPEDMIGKKITFKSRIGYDEEARETFTICGVFSTGTDFKKYEALLDVDTDNMETAEQIKNMLVMNELNDLLRYSFNGMGVVKDGYVDNISNRDVYYGYYGGKLTYDAGNIPAGVNYIDFYNRMSVVKRAGALTDVNYFDTGKTSLDDNEILLSETSYKKLEQTLESLGRDEKKASLILYMENGSRNFTVAGYYIDKDGEDSVAFSDATFKSLISASYDVCFGTFDGSRLNVIKIVNYSFERDGQYYYKLVNHVTEEIAMVNMIFTVLKTTFICVGVINAVFASLLLSNFIALGVMNKKTEIGILRAIGARGVDVFKVFFSESGIIAGINFLLSSLLTGITCFVINKIAASAWGIYATMMNFGVRQIFVILLISFAVAAIASFLPVYKLAKKKPVDVILNK